jgi:PAS domain S-box-containing protein
MEDQHRSAADQHMLRDYSTTITILEHLSDAIFILNADGEIEYANKVALDMLSLRMNDLIGSNLDNFIMTKIDFENLSENGKNGFLLENIYRGVFNEFETSLVNKEYVTPVVISFGLVRDLEGNINYIIASAKDITIRKQLEREMEQQQLLALSRDRYRELGELAVNMVHNLSQPVTSIRLSIELLSKQIARGDVKPEQMNKHLQKVLDMLDSITGSITNVRNFAFLTEDESLKPMQLKDVLKQSLQQIAYELNENNIAINVDSVQKLPQIMANPINIQQMFVALIKFLAQEIKLKDAASETVLSSEKSIIIKIRNNRDRWLQIVLQDNSKYPEKDEQPKMKSAEDPLVINTNLELTVVQIILTSIGGDFKVEHDKNGHSIFVLRIPIDLAKERDQLLNLIELMHN